MTVVTYPTLTHVAMEAREFPESYLAGCETSLSLFSAAFLGHNDSIHFALAGMRGTCVDTDGDRLEEMRSLYPDDWEFVEADAFEFAVQSERTWDVVSVDPFTDKFLAVAERAATWCHLANRVVYLGAGSKTRDRIVAPEGWAIAEASLRSSFHGGIYWVVLERA